MTGRADAHRPVWERTLARIEAAREETADPVEVARLEGAVIAYREALYGEPTPGVPVEQVDVWRWEGILAARPLLVSQAA